MLYSSSEYREIDKAALRLRLDYGFLSYSIDVFSLAKKMGIIVIPYSKLSVYQISYICKQKERGDGFSVIQRKKNGDYVLYIFYNDLFDLSRQRFTIAHEIKHILYMEESPDAKQEDLANHFARYLLAPTCLVMKLIDKCPMELACIFDISLMAAENAYKSAKNRINAGKEELLSFETEFVEKLIK